MANKNTSPGVFITFEGGDGCGKSTQIALTAGWLQTQKIPVIATFEPGGTALGQTLRNLVQHGPEDVDPRTEALLYATDRAYHTATMIRPALESEQVVLCDRFLDSSVAYQGAARKLGTQEVRDLSLWAVGGLLPDLTLLFDADPTVLSGRQQGDLDRLERESAPFHQAVREQYLSLAAAEPNRFVILNADQSRESLQSQIQEILRPFLESCGYGLG